MNAYYTYIAEKAKAYIVSKYSLTKEQEKIVKSISRTDGKCMTFISKLIGKNDSLPKINTEPGKAYYRECGNELSVMSDDDVTKLYEDSLTNISKKGNDYLLKHYTNLQKLSSRNNIQLFFMLVFQFPYLCRCEFIHGRKPTILLAFEDEYEVLYLHKVNIILNKFLSNMLAVDFDFDSYGIELVSKCYIETLDRDDKKVLKQIIESIV